MDRATTARTDSKPPTRSPLRSVAEHLRRCTFTAEQLDAGIKTGELFRVPLRKATPAELRDRVMDDKEMSPADARDLLMLSARAQPDGSLRGTREGRDAFFDVHQLAAMLRISVPTFISRWKGWQAAGWVTTTGRPNQGRSERWLLVEGDKAVELAAFTASRDKAVELAPFASIKESLTLGVVPRARSTRASAPQSRSRERPGLRPWSDREQTEWRNGGGDPTDCLRLGIDMLALGIPVQIIKPSGTVIEARRDTPDVLMRMLGSNNPTLTIGPLISDKPSLGVLSGDEEPRVSARIQRVNPKSRQPLMKVLAALEDHGFRPVRKGDKWSSRCPAHERSKPDALQVYERPDGKVNVKCFKDGGCDYEQILDILGLKPRDLYPQVQE